LFVTKNVIIRSQSLLILLLNISTLWLLSLFAFNRNPGRLFTGVDGPTLIAAQKQQILFFGITPHLHSSILEGLGNTYINNLTLFPTVFNYLGNYSPVQFFAGSAVLLFISIFLVGWNYSFSVRTSFISAWLLTILFLPYFKDFRIYNITETAPNIVMQIFIFVLIDIAIQKMGSINWLNTIMYGGLLMFAITIGFVLSPIIFILILPILLLTTIHAFVKCANRNERFRKLVMGLIILLLVVAAGWVHYLFGLVLNTAANVFSADIKEGYRTLIYVSILFQGQLSGNAWGPWFFCSAILGILIAIYQSSIFRGLGIVTIFAQLIIIGGGLIAMSLSKNGIGPPPIYCEIMLFPIYSLFTVYFYTQLIQKIILFEKYSFRLDVIAPFFIATTVFFVLLRYPENTNRGSSYSLPPASTVITEILEKEIAIHPNALFSGRVANIFPQNDWLKQCAYFLAIDRFTGNDHQSSGLWLKNIPTLHEYNQGITPGFYLIYRKFLAYSSESVNRNWSNFSKINLKILKLLGVRFIITPIAEIKGTKLRAELKIPNKQLAPLFLHELSEPNINGISAKKILTVNNISEAENLMNKNDFKLDHIIIANKKFNKNNFLPTITKKLSIEKGGFHLQARSMGETLLLLPIEFSHCLHMKLLSGTRPKIIRVNIALTGILFNRQVDILLDNRTGPFSKPLCKLKDYLEFKKLLA
jgi:hypothetical protein